MSDIFHLPSKIYQNWWKFEKVLAKTKMLPFLRHGVVGLHGNRITFYASALLMLGLHYRLFVCSRYNKSTKQKSTHLQFKSIEIAYILKPLVKCRKVNIDVAQLTKTCRPIVQHLSPVGCHPVGLSPRWLVTDMSTFLTLTCYGAL